MKKVVYTLALDGYPHEMTDLTFPWIEHYARKIKAEFEIIHERKFPDWPPTAEKLQLWELGQKNDWTIFIDADALINPDLFDVTSVIQKDTVLFTGKDMANMRFRASKYDLRDQRFIGACTWFVVCSDWTIDLWRPLDMTPEEAVFNIFPTNMERTTMVGDGTKSITPEKLIEDYICSQNIARFGLKHQTIEDHLKERFGRPYDAYYWHHYNVTIDEKILECLKVMNDPRWKLWEPLPKETKEKYKKYVAKIQAMPKDPNEKIHSMMRGMIG